MSDLKRVQRLDELKDFREVVRDLSGEYGVHEEVVEAILVAWARILYLSMTGREPDDALLL